MLHSQIHLDLAGRTRPSCSAATRPEFLHRPFAIFGDRVLACSRSSVTLPFLREETNRAEAGLAQARQIERKQVRSKQDRLKQDRLKQDTWPIRLSLAKRTRRLPKRQSAAYWGGLCP